MELVGTYNTAKVFTDLVEETAISQIQNLLNIDAYSSSKIRIMPDVHAGAGCTIGTTMTINDKICPNLVGVDIGCGVLVIKLAKKVGINLQKFDDVCHNNIKYGLEHWNEFNEEFVENFDVSKLNNIIAEVNTNNAKLSLGSLGGGNHFVEVDVDKSGNNYIVIHCGSRHLGLEVAKYHQKMAIRECMQTDTREIIEKLKAEGRETEIQSVLTSIKNATIPNELAYVSGVNFDNYINDMKICQEFAVANRWSIWLRIKDAIGWKGKHVEETFETIHNYIDIENMILRKGSVSARFGEKLIIPMNMRDGSLICVGKGNEDWNNSAPHGAGRLMSRSKAKDTIDLKDFKNSMKGIYSTTVCRGTIDESPQAYKPMDNILENIKDTVDVVDIIKPIYNFKAIEE